MGGTVVTLFWYPRSSIFLRLTSSNLLLTALSTPQSAVARAATRIALYMMREENEQTDVNKVQETQHAHDFFVVNSCKVCLC